MNTPVGIPSGWEEFIAWAWTDIENSTPKRLSVWTGSAFQTGFPEVCADAYEKAPHDWRVLE